MGWQTSGASGTKPAATPRTRGLGCLHSPPDTMPSAHHNRRMAILMSSDPLVYGASGYKQPVSLGSDGGYETIGYSAVTEREELIGGRVEMLRGMSERLKERAMYRRQRRKRKRYRPPRFDNRRRPEGWLAPSIQHKLDAHVKLIARMRSILPVTRVIVEVANFDVQKIKEPEISGVQYQRGEQAGFWNLREYILHRDGHECQNPKCTNRGKEIVLRTHHLGYWRNDYGDRPGNLITLCTRCHTQRNHQPCGFLYGWEPTVKPFRAETFMTTVRWRLVDAVGAEPTYGYITKSKRIALGLEKSHHDDAFVIAGGTDQTRAEATDFEQIRNHARARSRFCDAIYVDVRTGEKAYGKELHCGRTTRNRNLNGENLREYRGQKVRRGRISVRRNNYPLRPKDIALYDGEKHVVKGVCNYGKQVALYVKDGKPKYVAASKVVPLRKRKGLCVVV
jgi:hypothetical protein